MPRLRVLQWKCAPALAAVLALAGCSAGMSGIAQGPLPYQHSNAIAPAGYSESQIGPDRYRIEVKGPLNTPRERMEKIAATRAAEIGKEGQLGFFKIDNVQHGTHCETFKPGPRAPGSSSAKTLGYAMTTADVSYAKNPPDASYQNARTSFDQYRAELDQDQSAPAPVDPTAAAQCG
ncbi:hypothetical protein [Hyphomicrobium sp.]|uniref:CC0125/CC1285 family lipoprotein n=1 Tax=Hyphomicrobium sp. TaxID=82 RepID=UPI0025BF068D|nr:hypothetical protein [Hyphomicrobium sp.]MCC7251412.1 hypothetical protein [Hyphomicrobium sp.]